MQNDPPVICNESDVFDGLSNPIDDMSGSVCRQSLEKPSRFGIISTRVSAVSCQPYGRNVGVSGFLAKSEARPSSAKVRFLWPPDGLRGRKSVTSFRLPMPLR